MGFWEVVEADEEVVTAAAVAMEGGGGSEEKRRSRKNRMEDEGSGKFSGVGLGRPRRLGILGQSFSIRTLDCWVILFF